MPRHPSDHNYIDPFYIEDPLRPANNVGRNCFRVFQVSRAAWQRISHGVSHGSACRAVTRDSAKGNMQMQKAFSDADELVASLVAAEPPDGLTAAAPRQLLELILNQPKPTHLH